MWYPYGFSAIVNQGVHWANDSFVAYLVRTGATQYLPRSGHSGMNFVSAAFRAYATAAALAGKSIAVSGSGLVLDANDLTIAAASGTGDFHAVVIARSAATEAGQTPVMFVPLTSGITLNTSDVTIAWNNPSGIGILWGSGNTS